jgi:hypothetical protein
MKYLMHTCKFVLVFLITGGVLASCSASRHIEGFYYHSPTNAPDIKARNEAIRFDKVEVLPAGQKSQNDILEEEMENIHVVADKISRKLSPVEKDKMQKISGAFISESRIQQENGTVLTNQELVEKVTNSLVSNGTINPLSERDSKKLDRLARKLDKKIQKDGKDIDVKNNTNLELFFLIMGVAGLVLGILGVWFGWLLLVVFGGLYLYYKLVK